MGLYLTFAAIPPTVGQAELGAHQLQPLTKSANPLNKILRHTEPQARQKMLSHYFSLI